VCGAWRACCLRWIHPCERKSVDCLRSCALSRYVYLVDSRGRVRWRASGGAQGDEAGAMLEAAQQLLGEPDELE